MSYLLNQIQKGAEQLVGASTAEILLNSLIGAGVGYLLMRFAKSSALIVGVGLIGVELVSENAAAVIDRSTLEKYSKTLLEFLTLDEVYRRCAGRGFLGGFMIGMTFA